MNKIEKITELLNDIRDYYPDAGREFKLVIEELLKNGIGNGVYKNFMLLSNVISLLTMCQEYLEDVE